MRQPNQYERNRTNYTEAMDEAIKEMMRDGNKSYSEIADLLQRKFPREKITKCSVVGRVWRLKRREEGSE